MWQSEIPHQMLIDAQERLERRVRHTELIAAPHFSELLGARIFLKCENLQKTGAFKLRGAMNFMTARERSQLAQGVTAASAGNHAQGVAYGADLLGVAADIFMPESTPQQKVQATKDLGAAVHLVGANYDEAAAAAKQYSAANQTVFIHPFDDPLVIAGQGTIGFEIIRDLPDVDTVVVPIGGGGLLAGVALAMKQQRPDIRLVGVQVLAAPSMARALEGGSPVDVDIQTTIADGIAVKKAGALTMPIIQKLVDDIVLVSEEEVALSIVTLLERCKLLVEGAGAVSLAAVLHRKLALRSGERVVCLLSGGNIDVRTIATVVERGLLAAGRYLQLRVELVDAPGALSRLASALATVKANINEIKHDRRTRDLMLGETAVELVLETRGREHGAEIIEQLRSLGYRVHAA